MDIIDEKITNMLSANARQSFATIGKAVDLSTPAVGKSMKQLEEKGFILGYSLHLNYGKFGVNAKAYINLKFINLGL